MPIHSLELTNTGPFRHRPDGAGSDSIKLEFDANVNLIIGPNNVGKSTILQALVAITARYDDVRSELPRAFANAADDIGSNNGIAWAKVEWTTPLGDYRKMRGFLGEFVTLSEFGENTELVISSKEGLKTVDDPAWEEIVQGFGYADYYSPTSPQMPWLEGDSLTIKADEGDCEDDTNMHMAIDLVHSGAEFQQSLISQIAQVILEMAEGFQVEIGSGTFDDYHDFPHWHWRRGRNKFSTMDGELTFPELSHGTRSVFAWVAQFMLGMARHYEGDSSWKRRHGIFIIDEIDAHLHPSWQRRIIPALQRHFPNVQIFASTHSPMMVAGLKKGQVHLLKRDETGQVVWSRNEQDVIGWTADEIYRTFMGIDDPTDERTAGHVEELRQLRSKDSLKPEDEARMQKLRRLVNEDLLARGAHNAQQERFDQMMQEYLRSRTSDLSQDGS